LSHQYHGARTKDDEHAGQQPPLFTRDRPPRTDPRPSPARLYDGALQALSRPVRNAVLDRRLVAVLGVAAVGYEISEDARGPHWFPVLAQPPLRPHHFLAQLPSGEDDPAGMHRPARQPRRTRSRQCDGGSAPLVQWNLFAALSSGLSARRPADLLVA